MHTVYIYVYIEDKVLYRNQNNAKIKDVLFSVGYEERNNYHPVI